MSSSSQTQRSHSSASPFSFSCHQQHARRRQCRERWNNYLDPTLKTGPWTEEEDQILLEGFARHGSSWSELAKLLPGRNQTKVRDRWKAVWNRQHRAGDSSGVLGAALHHASSAPMKHLENADLEDVDAMEAAAAAAEHLEVRPPTPPPKKTACV